MSLLFGATAFAGSFTSNFASPNQSGYTLTTILDTNFDTYPEIYQGALMLITNELGVGPVEFLLNDLDNGSAIDSFTASFQLQFGPGTTPPADGMSFCFGPDVVNSVAFGEAGPTMPNGGVCIEFDTYNHGGPDGIGTVVKMFGTGDATTGVVPGGAVTIPVATMVDSQMHPISIQVKRNGTLNMVWNGQVIYTNLFLPGWTPVQGQFAFGSRNGGSGEDVIINNLVINTTLNPASPAAPSVVTPPQSVTVNEGSSASFSIVFDGDAPFTFQWTENGSPISGATNNTLTLTQISYNENNAQIACIVANATSSVTSPPATLTVIKDTTPPTVTSVVSDTTFSNLVIVFSKPVSASALTASNYKLTSGATVLSVTRVSATTVTLATSLMTPGTTYTLTINGVQDLAATPNTIAANTMVSFETFVYLGATLLHKVYYNCSPDGFTLADLFADPRYPNNPDRVDLATTWEWPPNDNGTTATDTNKSMFYDSLEGYFIPPTTGDYVFYMCGDDEYYMYLSTDESMANMEEIASEPGGWSDARAWVTDHSGTLANWNSATYSATQWPNGNQVTLTAGQKYFLIVFHHDHSWSGGDWFGATYWGPTNTVPMGNNPPTVGEVSTLTGSVIGYYFNPAGSTITFNQNPQNTSIVEGTWAWLSVAATGASSYGTNVIYQWQIAPAGSSTWTNVPGANNSAFQTPMVTLADNGMQVRVIGTMAPITATSTVATVTVLPNAALVASAGAMLDPNAGTVDIGIAFSATVDDVAGSSMANYSVSSGTITGLTWCTNRFTADSQNPDVKVRKQSALLTVTGFTGGTVTLKNMTDVYGNKITSTNIPITVSSNMSWGVVGANVLQTNGWWNAAVPVGPGAFDVYSDGIGEWGSYDETTFVYEQVTGDFDKKLRVEYQDGSSEWGRAGIIVRENTSVFGMSEALQTGSGNTTPPYDGLAGRYQKCHVNPVGPCLTGPGTDGNASWEGNRRLDTGGASTSCLTNVNALPEYPNAWCRIQRKGQTFSIFRSADGVTWELLGQTVWGQDDQTKTPMPNTVYVGPEFSPENGNVTDLVDQGTFLAQFRDYGDYVATQPPFNPGLTIGYNAAGKMIITWTSGTLLSSSQATGGFSAVAGATSPYVVNPKGLDQFYRVKQ